MPGTPAWAQNFSEQDLLQGSSRTVAECAELSGTHVWAQAGPHSACLRWWRAGFEAEPPRHVLMYFTGDVISHGRAMPAYLQRTPAFMQAFVDGLSAQHGVPVVLLARPGTYGSSGDHRERRREPESRLISSALDALAGRWGVQRFSMMGFSGGGHVAAALVGWRPDLACVALASAVSSPRERWTRLGLARDVTGHADSYEPLAALSMRPPSAALRVFVVGHPMDTNTPWPTQRPFGERLMALGVPVREVEGEANDPERHDVSRAALAEVAACMKALDAGS